MTERTASKDAAIAVLDQPDYGFSDLNNTARQDVAHARHVSGESGNHARSVMAREDEEEDLKKKRDAEAAAHSSWLAGRMAQLNNIANSAAAAAAAAYEELQTIIVDFDGAMAALNQVEAEAPAGMQVLRLNDLQPAGSQPLHGKDNRVVFQDQNGAFYTIGPDGQAQALTAEQQRLAQMQLNSGKVAGNDPCLGGYGMRLHQAQTHAENQFTLADQKAGESEEYSRTALVARDEMTRRQNGTYREPVAADASTVTAMKTFSNVEGADKIPQMILDGTWQGTISEGQLKELSQYFNIPDNKFEDFKRAIDSDPNITVVAGNAKPVNTGYQFTANVDARESFRTPASPSQTTQTAPAPAPAQELQTTDIDRLMDRIKGPNGTGNQISIQEVEKFAADLHVSADEVFGAITGRDPSIQFTMGDVTPAADAVYGSVAPQQTASATPAPVVTGSNSAPSQTNRNNMGM